MSFLTRGQLLKNILNPRSNADNSKAPRNLPHQHPSQNFTKKVHTPRKYYDCSSTPLDHVKNLAYQGIAISIPCSISNFGL